MQVNEQTFYTKFEGGMNDIKLSANLVNAIIQYIGSRPYVEVFQLIEAIQKEAKEQKPEVPISDKLTGDN